ncbi:unnamed protein product [Arabis nemorensis]|uniref:Uncharacterized protein n=1 Tax=Arabis nemorensis TaxID=586526 RepID=A0A565C7R4_9BRAS|nr:unnamed protein product [Arabis nemorensis]
MKEHCFIRKLTGQPANHVLCCFKSKESQKRQAASCLGMYKMFCYAMRCSALTHLEMFPGSERSLQNPSAVIVGISCLSYTGDTLINLVSVILEILYPRALRIYHASLPELPGHSSRHTDIQSRSVLGAKYRVSTDYSMCENTEDVLEMHVV